MRKITTLILSFFMLFGILGTAMADVYVRGYCKSNGIYVAPHYRSNPDGNAWNNWSTQGNVNPYTGRRGTRIAW